MEATLLYHRDRDTTEIRLVPDGAGRNVALGADLEATIDDDRHVHSVTIRRFTRFHDFEPLLDIIGVGGIRALAQFQADVTQGRQRRRVTMDPRPLSRRALAALPAA